MNKKIVLLLLIGFTFLIVNLDFSSAGPYFYHNNKIYTTSFEEGLSDTKTFDSKFFPRSYYYPSFDRANYHRGQNKIHYPRNLYNYNSHKNYNSYSYVRPTIRVRFNYYW